MQMEPRVTGTKASLVKALKEEAQVNVVPDLPQCERKTAVVVDAMFTIRHWSFQKDDTFGTIAERFGTIF
jgi:hypothetical protein